MTRKCVALQSAERCEKVWQATRDTGVVREARQEVCSTEKLKAMQEWKWESDAHRLSGIDRKEEY